MKFTRDDDDDVPFSSDDVAIYTRKSAGSINRTENAFFTNRNGRFTASEIYKLMGVPKGKNEIFTQAAKTYINKKIAERFIEAGQHQYLPKPDGAAAIRWGRENELAGIFEAEQRFGIRVEKAGFGQETIVHESLPLAGTPDGFIGDDGLMEVKCPYSPENHIENMRLTTDTIALFRIEYYYQMQCLMFLTNRQYCYFVSYDPRMKKEYRLFGLKIPRNDNVISQIEIKIILAAQVLNSQNQNQNQNQ